jgi:hypothetical protein
MTVALVRNGFDLDYLTELDLLRFQRLCEISLKQKYIDKTEDAWTNMIASQAPEVKIMKKHADRWQIFIDGESAPKDDSAEFKATFGGGF